MKKHRIRRAVTAIKAGLTKVGARKQKGLSKVAPEALTPEAAESEETERLILNAALKNLTKIPLEELETNPAYRDPGQKAVGDTVYIPFIGSDREEAGLDVKTTAYSVEQYKTMTEFQGKTCDRCMGWGFMAKRKCVKCKGVGRV